MTLRDENGKFPTYAWPGGYPIYYVTKDCGVLCPGCANDPTNPVTEYDPKKGVTIDEVEWAIIAAEINYENEHLRCDHCGNRVESAYGEEGSSMNIIEFPEISKEVADILAKSACLCGKDFAGKIVRGYPHEGGWDTPKGRYWLYVVCDCGYEMALWKIGISRSRRFEVI